MPRILAIDYGRKRVGLAVTDPMKIFATALETVAEKDSLSYIKAYCERESVERFVVGEPKHADNSPSESAAGVNRFVEKLKKQFPDTPITRVDERYTTVRAQQTLLESGIGKMKRRDKSLHDTLAAVFILQTYLAFPVV